jgi:homoserine dehydrogenase
LVNVSGSDSIVEINTKGYGDNPIVIQSATEGAAGTARGVYADLLRAWSRI